MFYENKFMEIHGISTEIGTSKSYIPSKSYSAIAAIAPSDFISDNKEDDAILNLIGEIKHHSGAS